VAGQEIRVEESRARAGFGYLPEDPVFYNWMSAREVLTYAGRLFGLTGSLLSGRVAAALERVDLVDAAKRKVGGFSRGMRQRLGLAQALVNNPPVLILDEPASALDPIGRREILDLIHTLKESSTTVFMSTHILADVERTCDTVAIINKGRLVTVAGEQELRQRYAIPVFTVEVDGAPEEIGHLETALQRAPWVERLDSQNHVLRVFVHDLGKARQELPRLIVNSPLVLTKYEQGVPSLEDAFLRLLNLDDKADHASPGAQAEGR
jgi:ABC-2 type transport system ATP-binding protein